MSYFFQTDVTHSVGPHLDVLWRVNTEFQNTLLKSKGPESQLILLIDNFHCACLYYRSSESKGERK